MFCISTLLLAFTINSTTPLDQTALLQKLLTKNAGKTITFPAGTFMVRTLTVPKQTRLIIGLKTTIKGLPIDQPLPILTLSTGVHLSGSGLIDGNRTARNKGTGIQLFDSQEVNISGLRIREVAEQGIQIAGCKKITITNMKIDGCGTKGVSQFQAINIVTSQEVQVTGCRIAKAQHGIQWWGDDNQGWCDNIRISNNRIRSVDGGGIWGNKGRNVIVTKNVTELCGDVGVDFEHSANCSAVGNTVRDCKNYALAVFYGSEHITFTKNIVSQGSMFGHGIGLIGDGLSKQISFSGGTITTKGPSACGLVTVGTNVVEDVLVQGVRIVAEGKGGIPIRVVDNNKFRIINNPLISGVSSTGISLEGSSHSIVDDNVIVHLGEDNSKLSERGGIFVYFRSAQYPSQNNQIRRNTIRGYKTGINDECWGNVNSNNTFQENITPNLVHRGANNNWGGKALNNYTETKVIAPITIKQ